MGTQLKSFLNSSPVLIDQQDQPVENIIVGKLKTQGSESDTRHHTKVSFMDESKNNFMLNQKSDINFSKQIGIKTEQSEAPEIKTLGNIQLGYANIKTEPDEYGMHSNRCMSINKNFRLNNTGSGFLKGPREMRKHPRLITLSESKHLKAKNYGNNLSDNNRFRSTGFSYRMMTTNQSPSMGCTSSGKFNVFDKKYQG